MYSQKGGSLDVVCSSERKKSGSTLRPQHSALSVEDLRRKSDDITAASGTPNECPGRHEGACPRHPPSLALYPRLTPTRATPPVI